MESPVLIIDEKNDHIKYRDLADFLAIEPLDAQDLALRAVYEQLGSKVSRVNISDRLGLLFVMQILEADPAR